MPVEPPPPAPALPPALEIAPVAPVPPVAAEEALAPAARLSEGEVLPAPTTRSQTFSASFVRVSTTSGGLQARTDGQVQLSLPQETVDPERRLSSDQYRSLMDAWNEALSEELERRAGFDLDAVTRSVPLPFDRAGLTALSADERAALTQRAQAAASGLFAAMRQVKQPGGVGEMLVSMDMPVMHKALQVRVSSGKRQVGCSGLLLLGLVGLGLEIALRVFA
jgi:hypothetical protein